MQVSYHSLDYQPVFQNASPARTDTECSVCLTTDLGIIDPVQPLRIISGCDRDIRCRKKKECVDETAHKCIHVFCRACIEGWIAQLKHNNLPASCPSCGDNPKTLIQKNTFKKMIVSRAYQKEAAKRTQLEIENTPRPKKSKVENCKTILKVASILSIALFTIHGGLFLLMHSSSAYV